MSKKGIYYKYKFVIIGFLAFLILVNSISYHILKNIEYSNIKRVHHNVSENFRHTVFLNIEQCRSVKNLIKNSDFVTEKEYLNFITYLTQNNNNIVNILFYSNDFFYSLKKEKFFAFYKKYENKLPTGISLIENEEHRYLIDKSLIEGNMNGVLFSIIDFDNILSTINFDIIDHLNFLFRLKKKNEVLSDKEIKVKVDGVSFIIKVDKRKRTPIERNFYFWILLQIIIILFGRYLMLLKLNNYELKRKEKVSSLKKDAIKSTDPNSILIIDRSGIIIESNRSSSKLFKLKENVLKGTLFYDLMYDEESKNIFRQHISAMQDNKDTEKCIDLFLKDAENNKIYSSIRWKYNLEEDNIENIILKI